MKKLLCCLGISLALAGSISASAQAMADSIKIGDHYRVFHFYKPIGPGATLVFALHGSGGNGMQMLKAAGKMEAGHDNVTVVCPDGYKKYWNECRKAATSAANVENIDEEAFFEAMINYFKTKYGADTRYAYAIGFSGGGQMAYKLALTMPQHFKAITAVVANMPTPDNMDCGEAHKPVAVMIVNGTADDTNPYNGGEMKVGGASYGKVRSTEQSLEYWAQNDGYTGMPVKEVIAKRNAKEPTSLERYTYSAPGKPEVALIKVIGGGHEFPAGIDVFVESWSFFKRQQVSQ